MINKLICAYLTAIIVEVNFGTDKYFILFLFVVSLMSFIVCGIYKRQLKTLKDIYKLGLFLIIFTVFLLSTVYTKSEIEAVSYSDVKDRIYEMHGYVAEMKQVNGKSKIVVGQEKVINLENNLPEKHFPKYIEISVSSLHEYALYDRVIITGQIEFKNFQDYYEKHPLFFSYEFEKLFYNTTHTVSYPKNIIKNVNTEQSKNMYEQVISLVYQISETLKNKIPEHMQEPYASIAQGITLGEQDNILTEVKDTFRSSGLIHILVLSGANVSFIISILWYFLRNIHPRFKGIKVLLITTFSWIFIFMTGLTPPSVRAGTMSSLNILSEYFGKYVSTLNVLLLSLFILTVLNPLTLIYSPSLHLSFLACFGLFIMAPKLEKYCHFFVAIFISIFATTVPYILALVGTTSLFGTVLTFIVEPVVMLVTILSFLIIATSFVSNILADIFGILNTVCVKIILHVSNFGSAYLPHISVHISKPGLIMYYLILVLVFTKLEFGIIKENESNS